MKRWVYSLLLSFTMVTAWSNLSGAETLTQIDCELEPMIHSPSKGNPNDGHSRPRVPGVSIDSFLRSRKNLFQASTSTNWSGYAAVTNLLNPLRNSVTAVSGSWVVPTLVASASPKTYSSIWVGIDGYASATVEQIGTEQNIVNGVQKNFAWFEMYPRVLYKIKGFPVNTGDVISASVTFLGKNKKGKSVFELVITNVTQNVTYTVPRRFTKTKKAHRSSAEWIVEAPSSRSGVLPLANFQTATLLNCSATINGITGSINNPNWQNEAITMITDNNVVKAAPSALSNDGTSFSVTWFHE